MKESIKACLIIIALSIISVLLAFGLTNLLKNYIENSSKDTPEEIIFVKLEQPEFLLSEDPESDLKKVLEYYGVLHPEIVYTQAILETGHFRSKVFKEYNNLFGLYDSRKHDYFRFKHWTESVAGYKYLVQFKYKPPDNATNEDYYKFLIELGYAEDPSYVSKLKQIIKRNEKLQQMQSQ